MKKEEISAFKENIDGWIRDINGEVSCFKNVPAMVEFNAENMQHNYEIILELRDRVEELQEELRMMKAIQAAILETSIEKG